MPPQKTRGRAAPLAAPPIPLTPADLVGQVQQEIMEADESIADIERNLEQVKLKRAHLAGQLHILAQLTEQPIYSTSEEP